jgi:hypothetical protein
MWLKIKSVVFTAFAQWKVPYLLAENISGEKHQRYWLERLIAEAKNTEFGQEHHFDQIQNYKDFATLVPLRVYEDFIPYIERIKQNKRDVLWKGLPVYFAKTSGTTASAKYIPISRESIGHHITAARNVLLFHAAQQGKADFLQGKMIFLQGSPQLEKIGDIFIGRLSGIVYHHVPKFFLGNRIPSYATNCIEDWEEKIAAIIGEALPEKLNLVSGIPPWCIMFFERLLAVTNKKNIAELFPTLSLFIHGGVNFKPYENQLKKLMGKEIPMLETYPASEGFFAYQNDRVDPTLLLNLNAGIFYEFIPLEAYHQHNTTTYTIEEVKVAQQYVLVVSTNAGLWRYIVGDTIKFTHLKPYKIVVTGRIKQFISAFGEHVIAEEIEDIMREAIEKFNITLIDYHVCPDVAGRRYQWLIEAAHSIENTHEVAVFIHRRLAAKNIYYSDLLEGNLIGIPEIIWLEPGSFLHYQKKAGKLGGQNKVVRLSNDQQVAEMLRATRW